MLESNLLKHLEDVERRFQEIEEILSNPSLTPSQIFRYSKQRSELGEVIDTYREYKKTSREIEENRSLLADKDLGELAKAEIIQLEHKEATLDEKLRLLLIPKDPNDYKNVFLEIRAGTGGGEAALFASDLLRMYLRFSERKGWRTDILSLNETGIGGIKEVIVAIEGSNAFSKLKYESGVHRVQRIPTTEAGGRIHTSTATVAVLSEPEDVEVRIDEKELKIDT